MMKKFHDNTLNEIDKKLRRIPFDEKMHVLHQKIPQTISFYHEDVDPRRRGAHLYEIEILMLRSIVAGESKIQNDFTNSMYTQLVNLIRDQSYVTYLKEHNIIDRLALIAYLQFEVQKSYYTMYYRMQYIFNFTNDKVNIKDAFENKFGCSYDEFEMFCRCYFFIKPLTNMGKDVSKYTYKLLAYFKKPFLNLCKTREGFVKHYKKVKSNNHEFSIFDVNVCRMFPFIEYENRIYNTLFHFVSYACTMGLLFRLTDEDNSINDKIGKYALESYVFDILKNSLLYQDSILISEKQTKKGTHTPDILLLAKNGTFVIEIKKLIPSNKLRELNQDDLSRFKIRMIQHVCQAYRNIVAIRNGNLVIKNSNINNPIYGICVIFDDLYLEREEIYKLAYSELSLKYKDVSFDDIRNSIIIISLLNLETILRNNNNGLEVIFENIKQGKANTYDWTFTVDDVKHDGLLCVQEYEDTQFEKMLYFQKQFI